MISRASTALAVVGVLGFLGVTSCTHLSARDAERSLDVSLADAVKSGDVPHGVMWVDAPRHGIDRGFVHGVADLATGRAMEIDTPFYSASVGKLFVAAAVFALARDGRLSIDDAVTAHVPMSVLTGLPVVGGDEALSRVTIRMLLGHRSGLPDYFSGIAHDGAKNVFTLIASEPTTTWTRDDLFDYTRAHFAPAGAPGEKFHYADTNYDVLGLVLEHIVGAPFHDVVRTRILMPLQLSSTWYHAFEPPPVGTLGLADVIVDGKNLRGANALSADQAGGGLATTVGDLRTFMRALVDGKVGPLDALAQDFTDDAMHAGIDVGVGAWRIRPGGVVVLLGWLPDLVGHSGATGVWAYHVPKHDAVLVGAVSQATWQEKHIEFLLSEVLPVLEQTMPLPK